MLKVLLVLLILSNGIIYLKYRKKESYIKALIENIKYRKEHLSIVKTDLEDDRDIRELAELIDSLSLELNELKIENVEMKSRHNRLTTEVSHDLRTPLTSIIGYLELAKKDRENSQKYLKIAKERAEYLKALVDKFYELFISLESDDNKFEKIDLAELLRENLFNYYDKFRKENRELELHIEEVTIYSKKEPLEKIIANALDNMVKYSEGENTVILKKEPLELIFKNRTKIKDGDYAHLFKRFEVLDKSRQNASGLGLSIIKNHAEKLGFSTEISVKKNIFTLKIREDKN